MTIESSPTRATIHELTQICAPIRMDWFDNYCRKYISEGLSLMAIDTDTDELVGVAITTVCKRKAEIFSNCLTAV